MLNHSSALTSSAIGSLGMYMAETMRTDLDILYVKYVSRIMKYGKKGANILIDYGWLQQPPQAVKHENLVGV
jgi:hypothetical protein